MDIYLLTICYISFTTLSARNISVIKTHKAYSQGSEISEEETQQTHVCQQVLDAMRKDEAG